MSSIQRTLNDLPPELFPIIASQLPLHANPSSLLSLALTSRHFSEIVLPILLSRLILRRDADILNVFSKLLAQPESGTVVREVHIRSSELDEPRSQIKPLDIVLGLKEVIKAGCLPFLHTLSLVMTHYLSGEAAMIEGVHPSSGDFAAVLQDKCPRLKALTLQNNGSSISSALPFESFWPFFRGLSSLTLAFSVDMDPETPYIDIEDLFKHFKSLSPSLQKLNIASRDSYLNNDLLSNLYFPSLKSLTLTSFSGIAGEKLMTFWTRHPKLESVVLNDTRSVSYRSPDIWFGEHIPTNFLPNLRYLQAAYEDVLVLRSILHQLVALQIFHSNNDRIISLLNSLPEGLPNLKSLCIRKERPRGKLPLDDEADAIWREQNGQTDISEHCIDLISRRAPNLVELGLEDSMLAPWEAEGKSTKIAQLAYLRRLYFNSHTEDYARIEDLKASSSFSRGVFLFASTCSSLESVTNTGRPRIEAKINREPWGIEITFQKGHGLQIWQEDEAFFY